MVVHDQALKNDFTKMSDRELLEFRRGYVERLFAGEIGSQDHGEKKLLIELVDKEFERRFKKRAESISVWALMISVASIIISIFK